MHKDPRYIDIEKLLQGLQQLFQQPNHHAIHMHPINAASTPQISCNLNCGNTICRCVSQPPKCKETSSNHPINHPINHPRRKRIIVLDRTCQGLRIGQLHSSRPSKSSPTTVVCLTEILMKADENLARAAMKLLSSITASRVN